jgi:hypothetical protein
MASTLEVSRTRFHRVGSILAEDTRLDVYLSYLLGTSQIWGRSLSFESLLGPVGLVSSSRQVSLSRVSPWAASSVVQLGQWSVFKFNPSGHLGSASPEDGPEPHVLSGESGFASYIA